MLVRSLNSQPIFRFPRNVGFQIKSNLLLSNFRTKQVDEFTARLLEIHEKMMAINKKEVSSLSPSVSES